MDQQTRATFVLAASTLAAAKMQGQNHNDQSAVKLMVDILCEMEEEGLVPVGFSENRLRFVNLRSTSRMK